MKSKLGRQIFDDELQSFMNSAKEATITALVKKKTITLEVGDRFNETHAAVIFTKSSLWGKVMKAIFSEAGGDKETETLHIVVVDVEEP